MKHLIKSFKNLMKEKKLIMEKIIKDKNGFSYQLVGEVYYPILTGAELPIGIYKKDLII